MIHLAPSIYTPNTYYIFRDTGIEVRVMIKNNLMLPNHDLTPEEASFIRANLIQKHVTIKSSIGEEKQSKTTIESERFAL